MDFLNRGYAQVADLFRSMSPGARLTSGLLLVVILVSLGWLFRVQTGSADEFLFGGRAFSQQEIATMTTSFSKAGLNQWEIAGNRIRVPRGERFSYLAALAEDSALPDDFDTVFEEMIKNSSPFESRQQREMRYKYVQQKEAAMVVSRMDGIETATVKYDEVESGGLARRKEKRAMVAVSATGNRSLNDWQVDAVRETVVAACAGLDPENVTVTDLNAGRAYRGSGGAGSPSSDKNIYAANQRIFEQAFKDKIYDRLAMYPGVVVGVNVELNPELNHSTSTLEYKQPQAIESSTMTKDERTTTPQNAGRPGAVPNGVLGNTPQQVAATSNAESTKAESRDEQRSIAGQEQTTVDKAPLVPTHVTASIAVPTSYFEQVWYKRNPPADPDNPAAPDPEQLQQIETETKTAIVDSVASLLPPDLTNPDPTTRVTVTTFTPTPIAPADSPAAAEQAFSWLAANWQTLAMLGVGLFSLLMLRSMVRAPAPSTPAAVEQALSSAITEAADDELEDDEAEEEGPKLRRFRSTGPNLREELTDLVKEDLDAAANVLRNWIGDAA